MRRLHSFLHLTPSDRRLLISTALLLGAVQLGLWLLPFRTLQRGLIQLAWAHAASHSTNQPSVDRLVWAVAVASRYVPNATCLPQSLAAQVLLSWHGYLTQLRIGFARDEEGRLKAHSWLEKEGEVIVGGEDYLHYTPLPDIE